MVQHYDIETIPENLKYLFDTNIYSMCTKGAGFYKFKIKYIRVDTQRGNQVVLLMLKGTHWKSENAKLIRINFSFENGKLKPIKPVWFTELPEFFLLKQELFKRGGTIPPQFSFELNDIQHKYPEYFL